MKTRQTKNTYTTQKQDNSKQNKHIQMENEKYTQPSKTYTKGKTRSTQQTHI